MKKLLLFILIINYLFSDDWASIELRKKIEESRKKEIDSDYRNSIDNFININKKSTIGQIVNRDIHERKDELLEQITSTSQSKPNPKKWLLAISVENYDSTAPVVYSNSSGAAFVQTTQKLFGVPTQNTIYLSGDKATTGAVKDSIAKMSELAEKGDTIYFYYSGHGIPSPSDNESYILPKDKSVEYVSKEPELKLSNIYKTLELSKAEKIVAVVDACFSGMTDGKAIYTGTAAGLLRPKSYTPSQKMVILSAGKDNQFSNSYDAKGHRLFSYFIIKDILEGRRNINDLYQDVRLKVKDESRKKGGSYEQEPQMFGNGKREL